MELRGASREGVDLCDWCVLDSLWAILGEQAFGDLVRGRGGGLDIRIEGREAETLSQQARVRGRADALTL